MIRHVDEDAADVIIGCRVNDLTALALGANESGRAQQAQEVANQAYAHVELLREVGHRMRAGGAQQRDAQTARIAEQPEDLGTPANLFEVERAATTEGLGTP